MSETTSNNNTRNILIVVLVLLLLGGNGYLFYLNSQSNKTIATQQDSLKTKQIEIALEKGNVDSLTNELDLKIAEIQKLGGDTVALHQQLMKLRKDLKQAKGARLGDIKKIAELNSQIEDYIEELKKKDEEIVTLKKERESIYQDNQNLKSSIAQRDDSLSRLTNVKKELDEKVKLAQLLRAEGIQITSIDKGGKERKEDRYRARWIDKLKVTFNFVDNKVAKIETKEVMLRVIEPEGSTLSDVANGGGTLRTRDGKDVQFTTKQAIMFDNSRSQQVFTWQKGNDYKSGTYTIELWCEGHMMGTANFVVR